MRVSITAVVVAVVVLIAIAWVPGWCLRSGFAPSHLFASRSTAAAVVVIVVLLLQLLLSPVSLSIDYAVFCVTIVQNDRTSHRTSSSKQYSSTRMYREGVFVRPPAAVVLQQYALAHTGLRFFYRSSSKH